MPTQHERKWKTFCNVQVTFSQPNVKTTLITTFNIKTHKNENKRTSPFFFTKGQSKTKTKKQSAIKLH